MPDIRFDSIEDGQLADIWYALFRWFVGLGMDDSDLVADDRE